MQNGRLTVFGVRHHSPACARLLQTVLATEQPDVVLIEGPADFNPKVGELGLDHTPPVAIFSHYLTEHGPVSSYTPFCAFSPEWVALRWGLANNKVVQLADLPAWCSSFAGVTNRYRDEDDRYEVAVRALCQATDTADADALWDHLFEFRSTDELQPALDTYFATVRGNTEADPRDAPREAFMRAYAAWALSLGKVLFVCGGYHAPVLLDVVPGGPKPEPPTAPWGGQSHLTPWNYTRMDSFAGYQAGMPSPHVWETVWELGPDKAGPYLLDELVVVLRRAGHPLTVADHLVLRQTVQGLANLRGHTTPQRVDLLDGLISALVREPQDHPPPWTRRGVATGSLHPVIATVLRFFSGDRVGVLSARAQRPALLSDVAATLARLGITPKSRPAVWSLDWQKTGERETLRVLHSLRLLGIPGFVRTNGPAWGTGTNLAETFRVVWRPDQEPALIEAARFGSTLGDAVALFLSQKLLTAQTLAQRVEVLGEASFVGQKQLAEETCTFLSRAVAETVSLGALGQAAAKLWDLWKHAEWLEYVGAPLLSPILCAAGERALTLLSGLVGTDLLHADLSAVQTLCQLLHDAPALGLDRAAGCEALLRRATDLTAPAMLRGATLGALWSLGAMDQPMERTLAGLLFASAENRMGDFLAGLFALARQPALRDPELMVAIHTALSHLSDEDFLRLLPSLRLSFSWFPPAERAHLAEILESRQCFLPQRHPLSIAASLSQVPVEWLQAGLSLDKQVQQIGETYGLWKNPSAT